MNTYRVHTVGMGIPQHPFEVRAESEERIHAMVAMGHIDLGRYERVVKVEQIA